LIQGIHPRFSLSQLLEGGKKKDYKDLFKSTLHLVPTPHPLPQEMVKSPIVRDFLVLC
jgi:hypothetical protein